ncbi:bifunctional lysylphosphatidylglycerol flippase/synthetase MprF [Paeniglutamicibacter sp. NPDC012692]|uniref:bifunctional lysylphosphatidylglycerol flippase/synthetase MprF n=1 Tax=Paeniglutamicibacter sp. NPDC012692 TaxID=3364388 RepID=UPI0036C1FB4A
MEGFELPGTRLRMLRGLWFRLVRRAAGAPLTLAYLSVLWVAGIADSRRLTGAPLRFREVAAASVDTFPDTWWTIFTSMLWAPSLVSCIIGSILFLAVGLAFEQRMGSLRFGVAALVGHLCGTAAVVLLAVAVEDMPPSWTEALAEGDYLGPTAPACAVLAAGSAWMGVLWRRRIRTGLLAVLVTLVLYVGFFADAVRLVAALAGLLLGPRLAGRATRTRTAASVRELRVLVSIIVAASAIGPVVAALNPAALGPLSYLQYVFTGLEPRDPAELIDLCSGDDPGDCLLARAQQLTGIGGLFMAVVPSYLLLLCAAGLRRGRRAAWLGVAAVYAAMSVVAGAQLVSLAADEEEATFFRALAVLDPGDAVDEVVPLIVPMLLLAALLPARRWFTVRAPAGTYRRAAVRAVAAAAILAAGYVAAAWAVAGQFAPQPDPGRILADVPDRFLPLGSALGLVPAFIPTGVVAALLYVGPGMVLWLLVGALLLQSFRRPALPQDQADARHARAILEAAGGSNLAWMTTWPDNEYWFSPSGRSVVAYRVHASVALTLGDPVGPQDEHRETVDGFADFCNHVGWTPCFYSATGIVRAHTERRGWGHLQVAEETVVSLKTLAFEGKKFQDVRTALNRAGREGIRAQWYRYRSAPLAITEQIRAIDADWVAERSLPEMGFTLGGLAELADPEVRILVAVDDQGRVHGVVSWLPVHRGGMIAGWTLDYMRRPDGGFRPAMEFLIASAALSLKAEGYGFLSLSGAPLARSRNGEPLDGGTAGNLDAFLDWLGAAMEPVYGFRSLHSFKEKFQPSHLPLFLLYPDAVALPRIGRAVARAYLPDVSVRQTAELLHKVLDRKP